ncbi:MAG: DUF559 domain-containing protein [Chitinophagaceae bacterium]|nr:MAG: DUF559 domain-containing protein [Chitinophagaceae bacterium]
MLAIEVDGLSHNGEEATARDALRQQTLEKFGISFLRFAESEIKYDQQMLSELLRRLL